MGIFFLTSFSKCVQVFLKLKHESKVEHLFVVPGSARQFKIVLVSISTLEFALFVLWMLLIHCGNIANSLDQALNYLKKLHLYTNSIFQQWCLGNEACFQVLYSIVMLMGSSTGGMYYVGATDKLRFKTSSCIFVTIDFVQYGILM